jgi:hypothetical protein
MQQINSLLEVWRTSLYKIKWSNTFTFLYFTKIVVLTIGVTKPAPCIAGTATV